MKKKHKMLEVGTLTKLKGKKKASFWQGDEKVAISSSSWGVWCNVLMSHVSMSTL